MASPLSLGEGQGERSEFVGSIRIPYIVTNQPINLPIAIGITN
jgi:hypothetical protein